MQILGSKLENTREKSRERDSPVRRKEKNSLVSIFSARFYCFVANVRKCVVRVMKELSAPSPGDKYKFTDF